MSKMTDNEDLIKLFKQDMSSYNILSNETQIQLFKEYAQTKNPQIRELLINSNLPLVLSRAKKALAKFNKPATLLIDYIAEGAEGLIIAFDTFDYHKDTTFSTYATTVIDNNISKMVTCDDRIVKLSYYRRKQYQTLLAQESILTMKLKRYPTLKELAKFTGFNEETIISLKTDFQETKSLNEKINPNEEDSLELEELIPTNDEPSTIIETKMFNQELFNTLLKTLNDRELIILILRYGLVNEKIKSCSEIAPILHCKRQRVHAIEQSALLKLKKYYQNNYISSKRKSTIRTLITPIDDATLLTIIDKLNSYEKALLSKRYNSSLTTIISDDLTLEEFRYIFRIIIPKINKLLANYQSLTLKKIK